MPVFGLAWAWAIITPCGVRSLRSIKIVGGEPGACHRSDSLPISFRDPALQNPVGDPPAAHIRAADHGRRR